ncbi:ribosomal protein L7/L12 [Cyphellophora europaea CBS 101466]|uniref:Ribosomal protein L7/L12 n=1 Tax=Cyphellophora europaea (strain CBS 101466) TaxID=1220924 RepID=W2RTP0_CYPE1|nr:ribosomal protein L7/L12 [Cyphellophora europaea CBS 101466]ETN39812.1 ribosomal protein L7/L12 [Cyphellophora europaea CBS 101466]
MASSAPTIAFRRSCAQFSSKSQNRSLSSQCLRVNSVSSTQSSRRQQRRWQSTDAAAAAVNPKISGIVDQISTLTLLETADLVQSLKCRLNIPDISFAPPTAAGGVAAPAAAAEEDEPAAPAAAEKTLFTIKLESFEAASKPKIIKEIKGMLGLSLVDSKKFVESAPKMLKEGITKEDAEKIKTTLEGLGGKVSVD